MSRDSSSLRDREELYEKNRRLLRWDWNKPADENLPSDKQVETNVRRFYNSLKESGADGTKQIRWYDEGVGTQWYDQFVGGAIASGLELNIIQG